jgi:hypothetical protein
MQMDLGTNPKAQKTQDLWSEALNLVRVGSREKPSSLTVPITCSIIQLPFQLIYQSPNFSARKHFSLAFI